MAKRKLNIYTVTLTYKGKNRLTVTQYVSLSAVNKHVALNTALKLVRPGKLQLMFAVAARAVNGASAAMLY